MERLATCKLGSYSSVTKWISAQDAIIGDLVACGITVEEKWHRFHLLTNLPTSDEWRIFKTSLELAGTADSPANIIEHLKAFGASLRRDKGIPPDSFVRLKEGLRKEEFQRRRSVRFGWKEAKVTFFC